MSPLHAFSIVNRSHASIKCDSDSRLQNTAPSSSFSLSATTVFTRLQVPNSGPLNGHRGAKIPTSAPSLKTDDGRFALLWLKFLFFFLWPPCSSRVLKPTKRRVLQGTRPRTPKCEKVISHTSSSPGGLQHPHPSNVDSATPFQRATLQISIYTCA